MERRSILIISLIAVSLLQSGCGSTPSPEEQPPVLATPTEPVPSPAEASPAPLATPLLPTPTLPPAAIAIDFKSLFVIQEGPLGFFVDIINSGGQPIVDSLVRVQLYDDQERFLSAKAEPCAYAIVPGGKCMLFVKFEAEEIPADYAFYNIIVEGYTEREELLSARLGDSPVAGNEGLTPEVFATTDWNYSPNSYSPGDMLSAIFAIALHRGEELSGALCVRVIEDRRYDEGTIISVELASKCVGEVVLHQLTAGNPVEVQLDYNPSGYVWITQSDQSGTYEIIVIRGEISLDGETLDANPPMMIVPLVVVDTWWEQDGNLVHSYQPGEPLVANARISILADGEMEHKITLAVMQNRRDRVKWLTVFPPMLLCIFDFCDPRVDFISQSLPLEAGTIVELALEFNPGETTVPNGYYYMIVTSEGGNLWKDVAQIGAAD